MLASPATEPPERPDWLLEVKWDGYRAIAIVEHTNVRLLSRNGLSLGRKFEKIVAELERLNFNSAILDGEVVAVDQNGIPRFELLQRFQQKPQGTLLYYVFDTPVSRWERSHRSAASVESALPVGSVADRCKYLLRIHLTFNVRGHWDEFAVAIRAPWCQGSGHGSPSLTSSSTLSSTLVRRRHYHHLCTVVFAL